MTSSKVKDDTGQQTGKFPVVVTDTKMGPVCLKNLPPSTKIPFYGVIGTVAYVKKLSPDSMYVECHSEAQQRQLLGTTNLAGVSVICKKPFPRTDGVVYDIENPHLLQNHPDVIRYCTVNNRITRIVFASEILPKFIELDSKQIRVKPYCPPITRCTKCQKLNHTLRSCQAKSFRCSKCSQYHKREFCTQTHFKCVNCNGDHSSAFKRCPKQEELRKVLTHRSTYYCPPGKSSDMTTSSDSNPSVLTPVRSVTSVLSSNGDQVVQTQYMSLQRKTKDQKAPNRNDDVNVPLVEKNQSALNDSNKSISRNNKSQRQDPDMVKDKNPSFTQFVLSTVKPIMNLSPNTRQVNQLAQIYKATYTIKDNIVIGEDEKSDAEGILGISTSHQMTPDPYGNSTDLSLPSTSRDTDVPNDTKTQHQTKQQNELEKFSINSDTENIIIGDSIIRQVDEDSITSSDTGTQILGISGLTIEDCDTWLCSQSKNEKMKKVIMHVGINSCKFKPVNLLVWVTFISNIRACFPNAEIFLSGMIPALGRRSKLCRVSSSTLQEACRQCHVTYIDHYNTFMPLGSVRKSLYRRNDDIHPSNKGSALLSNTLVSYLR